MIRDTILILEQDQASQAQLAEIFQDRYKILQVSTEKEGIEILRTSAASLAVVLVNLLIPAIFRFFSGSVKRSFWNGSPLS